MMGRTTKEGLGGTGEAEAVCVGIMVDGEGVALGTLEGDGVALGIRDGSGATLLRISTRTGRAGGADMMVSCIQKV